MQMHIKLQDDGVQCGCGWQVGKKGNVEMLKGDKEAFKGITEAVKGDLEALKATGRHWEATERC